MLNHKPHHQHVPSKKTRKGWKGGFEGSRIRYTYIRKSIKSIYAIRPTTPVDTNVLAGYADGNAAVDFLEDGYLVLAGGVAVAGDGWFATLALDSFGGEGESAGAQSEDKNGGEMHGSVALGECKDGGRCVG